MLIQIHILQNYAPSNLNRDDTGSPKDAVFGGYRRGRISSQCLKRSIRLSDVFKAEFEKDNLIGIRTQRMPFEVGKALMELGATEDECKAIVARLTEFGKSSKSNRNEDSEGDSDEEGALESKEEKAIDKDDSEKASETKQLIFMSRSEIRPLAEKALTYFRKIGLKKWQNKKTTKIENIEKELGESVPRSVDIAMFGRMTTSRAFKDIQAAVQVAHAISTNAITQEFDYYTAIDDLKPEGEPGADMIGDVEFNSSTYYKYINVHWEGLLGNLGGEVQIAHRAILALLDAAVFSQPTGKQNSFAAQNLPDFILVEATDKNIPVNYANAFLKPVRPWNERTLMDMSIETLDKYTNKVGKVFNLQLQRAFVTTRDYKFSDAIPQGSLLELKTWLSEKIG